MRAQAAWMAGWDSLRQVPTKGAGGEAAPTLPRAEGKAGAGVAVGTAAPVVVGAGVGAVAVVAVVAEGV